MSRRGMVIVAGAILAVACGTEVRGQAFVPGTGYVVEGVGDDFEDPSWNWIHNYPKSSHEMDDQIRHPMGQSANNRFFEGAKRGHPDHIVRVETPPGGLPGSTGALKMQTLYSGIPGKFTAKQQQDDLIVNVMPKLGGKIPIRNQPSFVVRVYLPPFEQWEKRTGVTFGVRAGLETTKTEKKGSFIFQSTERVIEPYWPGMFIYHHSPSDGRTKEPWAQLVVRADPTGHDIMGPQIKQLGWWTFGMSFTPDGGVHYYAKPGVENLTTADYITSQYPYGYRAESFETFFFNVANMDDGRTWSTPWIIDDPTLYCIGGRFAAKR